MVICFGTPHICTTVAVAILVVQIVLIALDFTVVLAIKVLEEVMKVALRCVISHLYFS